MRAILEESGVEEDELLSFDGAYKEVVGSKELNAENIIGSSKLEVKTDNVLVTAKLNDDVTMETRMVDRMKCLVIPMNGVCSVNGIKIS